MVLTIRCRYTCIEWSFFWHPCIETSFLFIHTRAWNLTGTDSLINSTLASCFIFCSCTNMVVDQKCPRHYCKSKYHRYPISYWQHLWWSNFTFASSDVCCIMDEHNGIPGVILNPTSTYVSRLLCPEGYESHCSNLHTSWCRTCDMPESTSRDVYD